MKNTCGVKPFIIIRAGTRGRLCGETKRRVQTEWERWTEGRIEPMEGCGVLVFLTRSDQGQHIKHGLFRETALSVNQSKEIHTEVGGCLQESRAQM